VKPQPTLIGEILKLINYKQMKSILTTLAIVVVGVIVAGLLREKVLKF